MASVFPFAALRPHAEAAARVASVPYDVVSTDEARALASGNPLSFLHVSRPEIDMAPGADLHSAAAYEQARVNFERLRARAPLVVEDAPGFYVYRLRMGQHLQSGIAACFSIDEYEAGLIKKHEKTRPDKEDDRTKHMLAIGGQTGPVLLTYRHSDAIDEVTSQVTAAPPLFDFTAVDGIRHEIWRVPAAAERAIVAGFAAVPALYIADGHHRAASAARTRRQLSARGAGEHDRVLAVAFPDRQMLVLPYHRVVRDLNGLAVDGLLAALRSRGLEVRAGGPESPERKGTVAMYLAGRWHTLDLAEENPRPDSPAAALDVALLEAQVLGPILGIADIRTDARVEFVGGIRGTAELARLVDSGAFAVAFSMHAVSVDDLMRVADAGGIMPPKSTWFEPKLRDGLLSHLI
jgi:uncharacterized protein (DUF1015 family)